MTSHRFSASDEFIAWAQGVSGMLTSIRTRFGSVSDMVEHPNWDESSTRYVMSLIGSLRSHLADIDEELSNHVREKFGKEPR